MIERYTVVGEVAGQKFELIPISQAAKVLGYSKRHVRRLADNGDIIAIKINRQWFVYPQIIARIETCPRTGVQDAS